MTMEEGAEISKILDCTSCKSLFLTNKKQEYYLLLLPANKKLSTQKLAQQIGSTHLSFASKEAVGNILCTYPGAISILGLIYDNENNVIFDDDMTTREINGNAGYIDINNRIIKEPGTHRCEITEIESLDGYKKFNQEIIAEIEVGLNDSEEKYEVKDVKNKGLFSENLKMEKEEDGNGVLIVLANDPSVKIEDVKPSGPSFLPQTGDFDIIIKIISTMLIINLIIGTTIFIYKKRK